MVKPPILYSHPLSAPVRTVLMVARAISLKLELKTVDYFKGEHLSPEFVKLNPQHTLPVLDDNGVIIWDSHAISTYLIEKYSHSDSLYPKDLVTRARIDQRLHFDSGVLFPALRNANSSIFMGGTDVSQEHTKAMFEALDMLEIFLTDAEFLVGNLWTVADFACLTTVAAYEMQFSIEEKRYPNIRRWIRNMMALPFYDELVEKPSIQCRTWLMDKIKENMGIK